jgi:hypothetical protein
LTTRAANAGAGVARTSITRTYTLAFTATNARTAVRLTLLIFLVLRNKMTITMVGGAACRMLLTSGGGYCYCRW